MNDETMILDTQADVAAFLSGQTWAIRPEQLTALCLQDSFISQARTPRLPAIKGKIAVMPLVGILSHRSMGGIMGRLFGGTSMQQWGQAFDQMMADPSIGAIVIDGETPGGTVAGTPELAAKVFAARGKGKPIIGIANTTVGSAGYHILSQADQVVVSPSGEVGSIGVYAVHFDESAALEAAGIKPTFIQAGEYKTEQSSIGPLSPEAREFKQAQINREYADFVGAVARARGKTPAVVRDTFGKGRMIGAEAAVSLGMADRIATLDEVLDAMIPKRTGTPRRSAAERELRLLDGRETPKGWRITEPKTCD